MFKVNILHGQGVPFSLDRDKIRNGLTLVVKDVSDRTSIQELKQRIVKLNKDEGHWFNEKSTLMFSGHLLDRPLATLKDYKIGPDSNIAFAHWYKFNVPLSKYKMKLFKKAFDNYDLDGSGEIDTSELFVLVNELGMSRSRHQCKEMVAEIDIDKSGEIDFEEFCSLIVLVMKEDVDGSMFSNLQECGTLNDNEARDRDSGALVMWDPGYPGSNDNTLSPEERYGQVVFVKEPQEEKGRYIFENDYDEYLKSLPEPVVDETQAIDYGVIYVAKTNSYVFKSDLVGSSSP